MALAAGEKLGPYEILSPLGAGGMGAVYRARDTRLGRDVAIKISSAQFTDRFEREARAVAALNHPNICHLYDVGALPSGSGYLVMELIEGQTLTERIRQGPIPVEEALRIAAQIRDALEAAHEKHITHRDLKPGNVMLTSEGSSGSVVKVLDFGLAKQGRDPEKSASASDPTNSPTLTIAATDAGMILGTAAYMSPEQAKGKSVDKRADIWAFGVVLFEMLTGERPFKGEDAGDILASVIKEQPNFEKLPAQVRPLIESCLEKDPKKRLRDIGDAWRLLDSAADDPRGAGFQPATAASASASRLSKIAIAAAAVFALATAGLSFVHFRETPPAVQNLRYQIPPPGTTTAQFLALSPDGRNLAFVTNTGGPNQIWVRAMDTLESRALAGTDGATYPFWSPDGAYLGFFSDGKLKKIAVAGGPPQTLCDATSGRGGTWNRDGVILFSPGPGGVIFRVPAAGGTPVPVTKLPGNGVGEGNRFPVFLPDGDHFVYNVGSDKPNAAGVYVGSLSGETAMRLLPDVSNALYAQPAAQAAFGHLLFRREGTLMAQPFDAKGFKTAGDALPIAGQVPITGNDGFGAFSVAGNGMLVFRSGGGAISRELAWTDRTGKRLGVLGKPGDFVGLNISPDEKTLAVRIGLGSQSDIWLEDMGRGVLSRFTFRSGVGTNPVWSPDGSRVAFALQTLGTYSSDIYQKSAGGNGQEELLLHSGINGYPEDWSPDGKWIAYRQTGQKTALDLWLLPMEGDHKPVPYLQTPFDEEFARFSPDGRWMAYQSNESGPFQIYVQTVPASGAKYQISSAGGTVPRWRRDGQELFYVSADQKLMAVPIKLGATVEVGTPQPLFPIPQTGGAFSYAPMRDGQRFLVNVPAGGEAAAVAQPITVVTNWQAGFKK